MGLSMGMGLNMGMGLPGTLDRGVGVQRCRLPGQVLDQRFLGSVLGDGVHLYLVDGAPPTNGSRRGTRTVHPFGRGPLPTLYGHREGGLRRVTGVQERAVPREEIGHGLPLLAVVGVVLGGRGREDRGGVFGEPPDHVVQVDVLGDGRGLAVEGGGGGAGGHAVGLRGGGGGGAGDVWRGGEELG